jgi:hypothetical protein
VSKFRRIFLLAVLMVLVSLPVLAQPDCTCPPDTGSGTVITAPPSIGTEHIDTETPGETGEQPEEPVGDFNQWLEQNPNSPLKNLVSQAEGDPGLKQVLNQLTGPELNHLGNLLNSYQNAVNQYVKDHPRTWDGAGGGVRNFLNSLATLGGNDPFVRGCADMANQAIHSVQPQTGGSHPFTVHEYNWVPGNVRQYGVYGGAPIVAVVVVKTAGAGTCLGGPFGTVVGAGAGFVIALGSSSTEHNMAALQSTRNPKLVIVLDPHGVQNGNPESVHGPDHYSGVTGRPELGPPKVAPTKTAGPGRTIERGTVER